MSRPDLSPVFNPYALAFWFLFLFHVLAVVNGSSIRNPFKLTHLWLYLCLYRMVSGDDKCRIRSLWHALVQITIWGSKVLSPIVTSERYWNGKVGAELRAYGILHYLVKSHDNTWFLYLYMDVCTYFRGHAPSGFALSVELNVRVRTWVARGSGGWH